MMTLQPSPARTSAAARPMPFEPPVTRAVLPASFRSMFSPARLEGSDYDGRARDRQPTRLARRLDQAADPFAMTDLRAKPENARSSFDTEWTPRGRWFAGINLQAHWIACCGRRRRYVVGGDFFRMRNEIAEVLP